MKAKLETVEIIGRKFLRCQEEGCQWNVGWLGGYDWTKEPGKGTRLCNLGAKAMIETNAAPPHNCPQPSAVFKLAHAEFEM